MVGNIDVIPLLKEILDKNAISLLDVGCGGKADSIPNSYCFWDCFENIKTKIGIDINMENIIYMREKYPDGMFACMDAMLLGLLPNVDIIHCQNMLEHLNKKEALSLIKEMEVKANKQVIIGTPLGFRQPEFKNLEYYEQKNFAERHLCVFTQEEMEKMGYKVTAFGDYMLAVKNKG